MLVYEINKNSIPIQSCTSKGNQLKWLHDGLYLKADTMGYESISESLISEFLGFVEDIEFVDYKLCKIRHNNKTYFGCASKNFLKETETQVSLYRLLELRYKNLGKIFKMHKGKGLVDFIVSEIQDNMGVDITDYLRKVVYIDALTLNEDRHLNNLVLIHDDISDTYRMSPIFDNGLGLLSDINDYPLEDKLSILIRRVKSQPFATDFMKQVSYFERKPLVIDFEGFKSKLENCEVEFKQREFNRAKTVLIRNLLRYEGILWIGKKC